MIETLRKFKRRWLRALSIEIEERILTNWFSEKINWSGAILDIGGGASPYQRYLSTDARLLNLNIIRKPETDLLGDAHRLPIADASIDAVMLTHVLEHVRQPWVILDEAARVLKPGGEMLLIVPFLFKVHPDPEDHWRFTAEGLETLLADAFDIVELKAAGGRFAVIWEILGQIRLFEVLRIFNRLLARLPLHDPDYAITYCLWVRRKP